MSIERRQASALHDRLHSVLELLGAAAKFFPVDNFLPGLAELARGGAFPPRVVTCSGDPACTLFHGLRADFSRRVGP